MYVELHATSAFSFLRGASTPEQLAGVAAEQGLSALGLCDRDGVYGSARLHAAAKERGLRGIVGAELTMEDGSSLPVLVESRQGYQNLCRLITRSKLRSPKGESRVAWSELPEFAAGLVALTGAAEGPLLRAWEAEGPAGTSAALQRIQAAFGPDRVFIEVQRHGERGEERTIGMLKDLAHSTGLPLLATGGILYAKPEQRAVADVFSCLRHHATLDAAGRRLARNAERHLRSPAAMAERFRDLPTAVANTERLAERLEFSLENLGYEFPRYPVPAGDSMDSFLRKITWFGAEQRYGSPLTAAVRHQLGRELDLIAKLGFSGYFLIVWDLVNFCREQNIMCQGRGSAANSAVCYSLGITAVDPVGGKLLFERFLSEGRKGWPDIDIDLPSGERRERVIQEVYRRYAPRGAAMTANVITFRGRSAAREIGKALGFPEALLERFASLYASGDFPHTLELKDQLAKAGIPANHPRFAAFHSLYQQIYGLPRHLGQHSGGMIICQGMLDSVVPLENASMPGRVVAQWDKDDCEDLGIIKVDLLGLGMMSVLQDALEIARERGRPVDLARIPKDDPKTFAMMQQADTIGVFQIESRAQMATLPRMQPKTFYDVVIEVAIIRPGPIQGRMVHPYLERRAGRQPVDYMDERLRPVLERTLGVTLFQEQMLKIAMVMADFSGDEAEELRRALSFHRSNERIERVKLKLRQRMLEKGVEPKTVDEIATAVSSFALYGFPESHAISFALLAYGSAYLKAHYAAEFYAGLLNNQPMGFYSPATLVQDARRHGLRVLPVCAATSEWTCQVLADDCLRLGFNSVHGLREASVRGLLAARAERPFSSVEDFARRAQLSPAERRRLASLGSLNAFARHRRDALWRVEAAAVEEDDLFAYAAAQAEASGAAPEPELAPLEMMTALERLQADYRGASLTVGDHPMKLLRAGLVDVLPAAALPARRHGERVQIAGSVICRQRPGTAKGFVFISLEDETGVSNAVVTPALFEQRRLTITQEPFLRIAGQLQILDGVICVKAERIDPLAAPLPSGGSYDFH
jgi:error-prone DNA polymerase